MDDEKLLIYFKEALIPGEGEGEEAFEKRAAYCKEVKSHLQRSMGENAPVFVESAPLFQSAYEVYGIRPSWTPVFYSNEKLLPWQGASCWIFELEEGDPPSAMIQLPKRSFDFLGTPQETLAHEAAHIGRMVFEEPVYEEVIAYASSKNAFRRFFGPLFRSRAESMIFTSLLILVVVFDLLLLLSGHVMWYDRFMWLKWIPFSYFLFLLARLFFVKRRFNRLAEKLSLGTILPMTDREISSYSALAKEEILQDLEKNSLKSLRHRLLYLLGATDGSP